MHRLLSLCALAAVALAALSGVASASRIRANPSGAIRATSPAFVVEDTLGGMLVRISCEVTLTGEISREAEGTLNVLGSIVAGRFNRTEVANCRGGTMRVELFNAATISVKEVTNGVRVEILILNARVLIEDAARRFRCLYDALLRATTRENPIERFEAIIERVLEVRTLAGSQVCLGGNFVAAAGFFTLNQRIEAILSP